MSITNSARKTGVLLMTYGSATTAEHVASYLRHVYPKGVSKELIEDFENRYRLVGRSPLIDITLAQAAATENLLQQQGHADLVVRAAMLHSAPFIHEVVRELHKSGVQQIKGIILAPQFSHFILQGYISALQKAGSNHGFEPSAVHVADPWPTEPHFIEYLAKQTATKLSQLQKEYTSNIPVLFTTHSLPKRVVQKDPAYLNQLKATTDAVVTKLALPNLEWYQAYQSAGHTPEEWLKPDIVDVLAKVRAAQPKTKAVLIVPLQFLADHLEILYDLDIAGQQQCQEHGFDYHRINLPNTDPTFISALAALADSSE